METYAIQRWLFDSAFGRFDIDLAKSGVQHRLVGDVRVDPNWSLDYVPDRGLPQTRDAIAGLYGGACTPDGVLVGNGAQEALYLLYRSLLEAGDHVITTVPGWQQSWAVSRHIGCRVAKLRWTPGEPLDVAGVRAAATRATKLIVINSPGNPSGCRLAPDEWEAIFEIADAAGAWVVSDEEFAIDFRTSAIHAYERTISVSSLSKTYGVPGLRVGWAASASDAGARLIAEMVNYKRYTTIASAALSERIAIDLLGAHDRQVERYAETLWQGRSRLDRFAAAAASYVSLVEPQGTPFAWFNLQPSFAETISSIELAERLLADERVLVMPAEVFDFERGFRLTFARPDDVLSEGLCRFERVLASVAARR